MRPVRAGGKAVEGQDHLENDFSIAHVGRDLPARPSSSQPDRRAVATDRFEHTSDPSTDERSGDPFASAASPRSAVPPATKSSYAHVWCCVTPPVRKQQRGVLLGTSRS